MTLFCVSIIFVALLFLSGTSSEVVEDSKFESIYPATTHPPLPSICILWFFIQVLAEPEPSEAVSVTAGGHR